MVVGLPGEALPLVDRQESIRAAARGSKRVEDLVARAHKNLHKKGFWARTQKVGYICSLWLKESLLSNTAPSRGRRGS